MTTIKIKKEKKSNPEDWYTMYLPIDVKIVYLEVVRIQSTVLIVYYYKFYKDV